MSEKAINVLLVEGDADESAVLKRSIDSRDAGGRFAVTEAPRLSTASRLLSRERFDAVLLDLSLERSAGLEGFRKVRAQAPEVPVLVLTGLQDEALAAQAVCEGAQAYVIKGTPECCLLAPAIRHAIELKRLARAIERLLDGDPAAKVVVDAAGAVRYANPAAASLLGRAAEELLGRPFPCSVPAEGAVELRIRCGAGERAVEASAGSIAWNGAEALLVTLRDPAAGDRLRTLEAEARESLRVVEIKNQFMGRISHELRNSLATVKTAVFCLNDGLTGALAPRQTRLVEMISRNVDRQVKIIDNILDLARFQSGKLKIVPRSVELLRIVDELSQEFRLKNKAHRLRLELPGELPPVHGDPDLLFQVLRNLLDNAFRYARSQVTIKAADAGSGEVSLSVVDDGAGIPKGRLGELFKQFGQLDRPAGGNGYKGTGLGLAICKEIVEGHRGRIWASSGAGEGTSFTFILPKFLEEGSSGGLRAAVTPKSKIIDAAGMAPGGPAGL